jgi:exodeoxyribonuclease VII large subunit
MLENPDLARQSTGSAASVISVSALTRSVRDLLEHRYPLQWVSGEISNFILARSGHCYFTLKDDQAQVRCVMFRQRRQYLDWAPKDGMQVDVRALLTLYEARGDFQLTVETMRKAGAGALFEQFQRLRDKLADEGLFHESLKRSLPAYPRAIGVVTSSAAAAMRDILTTLARRNPGIPVVVCSVPVQGTGAGARVADALERLGASGQCDVVILARGGGSIEDLWVFNEEVVARAIRACAVPVVTGIGHETDFTIADFAADRRAPTPTGAAEVVSPERDALLSRLRSSSQRLSHCMHRFLGRRMQCLDGLAPRLQHPAQRLGLQLDRLRRTSLRLSDCMLQRLTNRGWRLGHLLHRSRACLPRPMQDHARITVFAGHLRMSAQARIAASSARLAHAEACLLHLNPDCVLARGYAMVRNGSGQLVTDAAQVAPGDVLDITLSRGRAKARVESSK